VSVSLDVLKAFRDERVTLTDDDGNDLGEYEPGALRSAQILSARGPVSGRVVAVAELPFSYSGWEELPGRFGVGNPYLGAEVAVSRDVVAEGGVRLPLVPAQEDIFGRDAYLAGYFADFERPEAFLPRTATATVGVRAERELAPSVGLQVQLAPTLLYNVSERAAPPDPDLGAPFDPGPTIFARYGVQAVVRTGPARLHGGLVGRQYIVNDLYIAGNTTAFVLGAVVDGLPVRPGATVRLPVRGAFGNRSVVGLSLTVPVP
jgi:hypothetical protein